MSDVDESFLFPVLETGDAWVADEGVLEDCVCGRALRVFQEVDWDLAGFCAAAEDEVAADVEAADRVFGAGFDVVDAGRGVAREVDDLDVSFSVADEGHSDFFVHEEAVRPLAGHLELVHDALLLHAGFLELAVVADRVDHLFRLVVYDLVHAVRMHLQVDRRRVLHEVRVVGGDHVDRA